MVYVFHNTNEQLLPGICIDLLFLSVKRAHENPDESMCWCTDSYLPPVWSAVLC